MVNWLKAYVKGRKCSICQRDDVNVKLDICYTATREHVLYFSQCTPSGQSTCILNFSGSSSTSVKKTGKCRSIGLTLLIKRNIGSEMYLNKRKS